MIKVCVIGLGYVGLPVALGISSKFETLGFDISEKRIKDLAVKFDSNREYSKSDFDRKKIKFSNNFEDLKNSNVYIICVPTPVKRNNLPELSMGMSGDFEDAIKFGATSKSEGKIPVRLSTKSDTGAIGRTNV